MLREGFKKKKKSWNYDFIDSDFDYLHFSGPLFSRLVTYTTIQDIPSSFHLVKELLES